jgi:hypothetical protein
LYIGNIQVNEEVVECQFELMGDFIAIVLQSKGAIWYHTSSLELAVEFMLPQG